MDIDASGTSSIPNDAIPTEEVIAWDAALFESSRRSS